ncbi:organic solute transporter Ostalpha-domain-containing protein [Mrakia frigida]|uniref:OSTA/TMEM184 family protein n=1 Tax=Mrakia frigida TaxID=29902 RepID=UPI003FCBFD9A
MAPSSGSGSSLPAALLHVSLGCTLFATLASFWSIYLHLKGYRRPALQRLVVRIMIMIPLYAISSLVSLHSLEAAFWIDAVRDLYEAFVIYTFFSLLVTYLGGERSLLILLHGRPPTLHPFPVSIFIHEMDGSDPYTYLGLKRGILQYVWVKPILALVTLVLKLTDTYADGKLSFSTPYTYVSIVYNMSICLSLYCLAMFWVAILEDVKPFRPTPKFLCVKGILFFSFWQGIFVSVLVASGIITKVGVYRDAEHMSLALGDLLICFEMPLFAIAHAYAFCRLDDYVDPSLQYVARMPFLLALRDAAGLLDVYFDFKATAQGRGMSYRSFEPAEGAVHTLGLARERRIRAGLRYEGGGKGKYWLPVPRGDGGILGGVGRDYGSLGNSVNPPLPPTVGVYNRNGHGPHSKGYHSPPLPSSSANSPPDRIEDSDDDTDSVTSLEFFDLPNDTTSTNGDREELEVEKDEKLYEHARSMLHGDWAYRVVDVSREEARRKMREEEENVLRGYGRDGRGRRRGEVWGRGLPGRRGRGEVDGEGSGVAEGKKKDTRKVYGAYDDEERLTSTLPSVGNRRRPDPLLLHHLRTNPRPQLKPFSTAKKSLPLPGDLPSNAPPPPTTPLTPSSLLCLNLGTILSASSGPPKERKSSTTSRKPRRACPSLKPPSSSLALRHLRNLTTISLSVHDRLHRVLRRGRKELSYRTMRWTWSLRIGRVRRGGCRLRKGIEVDRVLGWMRLLMRRQTLSIGRGREGRSWKRRRRTGV